MAEPRPRSVLVVEDEAIPAMMLAARLREEGYLTAVARDGSQALEHLASATFDAVITDIRMPVMDGRALVLRLRRDGVAVPVLVVSGLAAEAADLPVSGVFPKPVNYDRLVRALGDCLGPVRMAG